METLAKQYTNETVIQGIAELFDYGVSVCGIDGDALWDAFVQSDLARQVELFNPKYVSGMSGAELLRTVLYRTNIRSAEQLEEYVAFDRSPAYWAGWVLAQVQIATQRSYRELHRRIRFAALETMYYPLHEAPAEKAIGILSERMQRTGNGLKLQRERSGLSQTELAEQTGISVKTIQAYEQGLKFIDNAKYSTVKRIAEALACLPEDLFS